MPSPRVRSSAAIRGVRSRGPRPPRPIAAVVLAAAATALLGGCTSAPPTGTPIVRAVPADDAPAPVASRDGVIVLFKPGDRIELSLDVDGDLAHVEGDGRAGTLVVDREFMVWSGDGNAGISFDDGRTWRPADRALTGEFTVDWRRDEGDEGGGVNEIVVRVSASPR